MKSKGFAVLAMIGVLAISACDSGISAPVVIAGNESYLIQEPVYQEGITETERQQTLFKYRVGLAETDFDNIDFMGADTLNLQFKPSNSLPTEKWASKLLVDTSRLLMILHGVYGADNPGVQIKALVPYKNDYSTGLFLVYKRDGMGDMDWNNFDQWKAIQQVHHVSIRAGGRLPLQSFCVGDTRQLASKLCDES